MLSLLLFLCLSAPAAYASDIPHVTIAAAKFTPDGLIVLIDNDTNDHILLLRGIACKGREPGRDLENPGEDCKEIYVGNDFPAHGRTWSQPIEFRHTDDLRLRLIKVQTVRVS